MKAVRLAQYADRSRAIAVAPHHFYLFPRSLMRFNPAAQGNSLPLPSVRYDHRQGAGPGYIGVDACRKHTILWYDSRIWFGGQPITRFEGAVSAMLVRPFFFQHSRSLAPAQLHLIFCLAAVRRIMPATTLAMLTPCSSASFRRAAASVGVSSSSNRTVLFSIVG